MSEWIDVSRTIDEQIHQWPGDPPYTIRRVSEITESNSANVSEISTSVHIGTHIGAPLHFFPAGADIAALPLSRLCGPAVVVHVTEPRNVEVADLEPAGIRSGDRVLLRTANEALWRKPQFDENFHDLTGPAARWLADRGVVLVGIDYLSVDSFHDEEKIAHNTLLGKGVIIIESLDLSNIEPGRYELIALPVKLANADGSPARVIIRPVR